VADLRLVLRVADPGETVYNAAHAAHVLTRVLEGFLAPHARMDVLRLLAEAAWRGVPNNTNPESAWSRVFTAHYALARAHEGAGRWAESHSQYRKSLDAIQKSIDFDRLYYDTHRLKAVLLLEHYCDAEGASAELDVALRILRKARPSRQVKEAIEAIEKGPLRQLEAWRQSSAGRERCLRELARATSGKTEPSRTGTTER
jgi:tetratricopeptide (TPR) repeat protein